MKRADIASISAVVFCYALIFTALMIFPGADAVTVLCGYSVIGIIAWWVLGTCVWRTRGLALWLLAVLTALVCGDVINTWYFTTASDGTLSAPVLQNFDAFRSWSSAVYYTGGADPEYAHDRTGIFWAFFLRIFGLSITVPLLVSTACAILAIVLAGKIAHMVTGRASVARTTVVLMSLIGYFLTQATVLLKDCPLTLMMAMVALSLVLLYQGRRYAAAIVMLVVAATITAILRPQLLLMYSLGALMFMRRSSRSVLTAASVMAGCLLLYWASASLWFVPSVSLVVTSTKDIILPEAQTKAYDAILGDYLAMPFWSKLAWLPISIAVQFLVPFPWNFSRDNIFGPTSVLAHCDYVWYLCGGLILYWIFAMSLRSPLPLVRLFAWGAILTAITAFMTSGRVSRYCLCYLPLVLPAAAYTLVGACKARSLYIWMGFFAAAMTALLIVCHHLQTTAL